MVVRELIIRDMTLWVKLVMEDILVEVSLELSLTEK